MKRWQCWSLVAKDASQDTENSLLIDKASLETSSLIKFSKQINHIKS